MMVCLVYVSIILPATTMLLFAMEGLLFDTVRVYIPPLLPVVWVYCAVTGSSNTVSVPSVTVVESLVQVTVVAGPPVEIKVMVNLGQFLFRSESMFIDILAIPISPKET